LQTIPIT
jgi:transposase InsO family protein